MITSMGNNKVKRIIQLKKKASLREQEDVFIAEGIKMFLEAPEHLIKEVYITGELLAKLNTSPGNDIMDEVKSKLGKLSDKQSAYEQSAFEQVSEEVMSKMSETVTPQGILCVVSRLHYTREALLSCENTGSDGRMPVYLILETIQDPGNLGTIMRTAEAAGVQGIIMNHKTVDVYNAKVLRATMGAVFRVPFLYADKLEETVDFMKQTGIAVFAASLKADEDYDSISYCRPCAFMIGNEGSGLSDELLAKATTYIRIPMEGQTESLNAAVAASILMYEAKRQRSGNEC